MRRSLAQNPGHIEVAFRTGDAQAFAVNDDGHIVGVSVVAFNTYNAFLWVDGVMTDLSDAFDVGPGAAWDINDVGQIVGTGTHDGDRHAFLMTPLPVPAVSMWGMIILTLGVLTRGTIVITRRRNCTGGSA